MLKVFIVIGDGGEFYHELIDHGYPDFKWKWDFIISNFWFVWENIFIEIENENRKQSNQTPSYILRKIFYMVTKIFLYYYLIKRNTCLYC